MSFNLKRLQLGFRIHFEAANPIRGFSSSLSIQEKVEVVLSKEVLITKYNYKPLFIKSLDV